MQGAAARTTTTSGGAKKTSDHPPITFRGGPKGDKREERDQEGGAEHVETRQENGPQEDHRPLVQPTEERIQERGLEDDCPGAGCSRVDRPKHVIGRLQVSPCAKQAAFLFPLEAFPLAPRGQYQPTLLLARGTCDGVAQPSRGAFEQG